MKTIILTGGGTAGHVYGNIALLPKLKTAFDKIIYIGSENGIEKELLASYPEVEYIPIKTVKLVRKFTLKNLAIPFVLLKSVSNCKKIIAEKKPDVIFSKGGYVSIPVVFAGSKLKVPIVSHESDLSLGLANKLTKNKVKCICTTFPQTAQQLKNGLWVGPPIRESIKSSNSNAKKQFNIPSNTPVLLVMGGSQGSNIINNAVWENLEFLCSNCFVIHITGRDKAKKIVHKNYAQLEYSHNIGGLLSITDYAITRGGSNAIWELLQMKIPMIIIPLSKKISRGDQVQNAKYFEKEGFSITLFEEELTSISFKQKVKELIVKKDIIKQKMNQMPIRDGLEIIFKTIKKYANIE